MSLTLTIVTMALMLLTGYMLGRAQKVSKATQKIIQQTAEMKKSTDMMNDLNRKLDAQYRENLRKGL